MNLSKIVRSVLFKHTTLPGLLTGEIRLHFYYFEVYVFSRIAVIVNIIIPEDMRILFFNFPN